MTEMLVLSTWHSLVSCQFHNLFLSLILVDFLGECLLLFLEIPVFFIIFIKRLDCIISKSVPTGY